MKAHELNVSQIFFNTSMERMLLKFKKKSRKVGAYKRPKPEY